MKNIEEHLLLLAMALVNIECIFGLEFHAAEYTLMSPAWPFSTSLEVHLHYICYIETTFHLDLYKIYHVRCTITNAKLNECYQKSRPIWELR